MPWNAFVLKLFLAAPCGVAFVLPRLPDFSRKPLPATIAQLTPGLAEAPPWFWRHFVPSSFMLLGKKIFFAAMQSKFQQNMLIFRKIGNKLFNQMFFSLVLIIVLSPRQKKNKKVFYFNQIFNYLIEFSSGISEYQNIH